MDLRFLLLYKTGISLKVSYILFLLIIFFRNCLFSINLISILFAFVEEQLKTTQWLLLPIQWPKQWELQTSLPWPAASSGGRHRAHLLAFNESVASG